MYTEIEAKFLQVSHDEVRDRLTALGATLIEPMRLMRRVLLDYPDFRLEKERDGFVRVRDEGDKVSLTYKDFLDAENISTKGVNEVEVIVSSFEETIVLLEALGLRVKTYQESKRETWNHNGCEIVLDEWPWIKPYIEVEGDSEELVKQISGELGFDWSNAVFGSATAAFAAEYPGISLEKGENIGQIPEIKFDTPPAQWLMDRLK